MISNDTKKKEKEKEINYTNYIAAIYCFSAFSIVYIAIISIGPYTRIVLNFA